MASSKPIQDQIFRSRLTITYRTNITGTPQAEQLPFRLLVLGEFSGEARRKAGLLEDLKARPVRSIKRGTTVDHHFGEVLPVWQIPDALSQLRSVIPGKLTLDAVTFTAPTKGWAAGQERDFDVTGEATFSSSKTKNGLADIDHKVTIRGSVHGVRGNPDATPPTDNVWTKLEIRLGDLVVADYLDPMTRRKAGKVVGLQAGSLVVDTVQVGEGVLDEDGKTMEFQIYLDAKADPKTKIAADMKLQRAVPITSLDAFKPDLLIENIPELQRSRLLKGLLAWLQAELRNRPELRGKVRSLLPDFTSTKTDREAKLAPIEKLKTWVDAQFGLLKLSPLPPPPAGSPAPADVDAETKSFLEKFVSPVGATSAELYNTATPPAPNTLVRRSDDEGQSFKFDDRSDEFKEGVRLMNAFAVLVANTESVAERMAIDDARKWSAEIEVNGAKVKNTGVGECFGSYSQFQEATTTLIALVDERLQGFLDDIYHAEDFQKIEAAWRGLDLLARSVEAPDVFVDFLDVSKAELGHDLVDHEADIFSGELFNKVYVAEYDRYGGKPFAAMCGLYEFDSAAEDINFLRAMGKVANAAHCPFVAAAAPEFFYPYESIEEVAEVGDLDAILSDPRFGKWNELRDTDYAAYLGLTLPRYLVREPWGLGAEKQIGNDMGYRERVTNGHESAHGSHEHFLWGNAAVLFARNMIRSYEGSGWAQHIRGPRGGGLVEGLTSWKYTKNGYEEIQPPVEIAIPDYRELQFANNGFIPLVHKKGEAVATFFSAQSLKKPRTFIEDQNTKNAHLVTNLAYTFSITRIAHYVKRMMREYIGSAADGPYIQKVLSSWLGGYVTIITNPDDLTLRYYPFKAVSVDVQQKPGPLGWYKAVISVLPHAQFEGMDVELRLEAALGGP